MWELVKSVWYHYGGFRALFRSAYFWISLLILVLTARIWAAPGWWQDPISILPNLLGFTLGGYAILIAFGGADFQSFIVSLSDDEEDERSRNAFMDLSATFCIFVGLQVSALLLAVVFKAQPATLITDALQIERSATSCLQQVLSVAQLVAWGFSYWIFIYALTSGGAAVLAVFRVSRWFSRWAKMLAQKKSETDQK